MGTANSIAKGVTPYNIACTMGQPGDLSVQPGNYANGQTLEMKYIVRGNWIEFDTTQPTALGKWADPRFSCTYDLHLTLSLQFGAAPGPLNITSVKAQVAESKLDSHGIIADLVFVANAVTKVFKLDFIKKAQNAINGKKFDFTKKLNQGLAPFNAILAGYGGQGYNLANALLNAPDAALPGGLSPRSLPGATPQGPQLLLFMSNDGKIPLTGTGEIAGTIKWKKTLGEPMRQVIAPGAKALGRVGKNHPFGRGFEIRAIAQSGFGREGMFVPPMSEVGTLQSVTLDEAASSGDSYVLRYVIGQLPLEVPLSLRANLVESKWQGQIAVNYGRALQPAGWNGIITLKPGRNFTLTEQKAKIGSAIGGALRAGTLSPGTKEGIIIVSGKEPTVAATGQGFKRRNIVIPGRTTASSGGEAMLNPQPLPPKVAFPTGADVMLNPQPLPPKVASPIGAQAARKSVFTPGQSAVLRAQIGQPKAGGLDPNTKMTPMENQRVLNNGTATAIFSALPRPEIQNPTGTLAVSGIDFEVGLYPVQVVR
jgi:hypothetical protein